MLISIYVLIILIIYSPYSYASITEWYLGIQGGLSSLTGKHHYANAGDGEKKDNNNQRASENNKNNNNNDANENYRILEDEYKRLRQNYQKQHNALQAYNQNLIGVPVNAQGMIQPEVAGAPPPPPPPVPGNVIGNEPSPLLRMIRNHPLLQRNRINNNRQDVIGVAPQPHPISPPCPPPYDFHSANDGKKDISHRYGDIILKERNQVLGFHIGFLKSFNSYNKYVIGSEFYCNFNNGVIIKDLKVNNRASEGKISIRQPYTIGIAGTAGYYIHPRVLLYGRIGLEINKFINEYYNLMFVGASYPYNQSPIKERYNFSLRGVVPGCGIKFSTLKNIDLSLEYTYSMMQKIQLRSDEYTINSVNRGYLFQPNQHRFMVKLSYFFISP